MNYQELVSMRDNFLNNKNKISETILNKFEKSFEIEYTHNSTAIEGNTLSLIETKAIIDDNISVGGKSLREIYEVVNHNKAYSYIKNCIKENKILDEKIVKDIHSILMENIFTGGIYRNCEVRITGAKHKPPTPSKMYEQIKYFFSGLNDKKLDSIELAAYTHAEFVKIHPFEDGNGRTSRLIMNYQLISNNFLPISIKKENRLEYFETLEEYAINDNLKPFISLISDLEQERLKEYLTLIPQNNDLTK